MSTTYNYRTKPWPHQVKANRRALKLIHAHGGAGLFVPLRWGKSKAAIDIAGCLHLTERIQRVLVVTIVSGIGVWEDEIAKHCAVPYTLDGINVHDVSDINPSPTMSYLRWRIVNYESVYGRVYDDDENTRSWHPARNEELKAFDPQLVIIDEIHHVGRASTVQGKHVYLLCKDARVLGLTGTPFHRKPLLVHGMMKMIDESLFGTAFTPFRDEYALMGGIGSHEVLRYRNLKRLRKKVLSRVYYKRYVPTREPMRQVIPIELDESADFYRRMALESFATIEDEAVTAPIVLTKHLRLLQIAGGWVKTERGTVKRVGREKARVFEDWLSEMRDQDVNKLVVACRFIPELKDIIRMCKRTGWKVLVLHGGVPKGKARDKRRAAFARTKQPVVMVCQVSAAKEAIDLSAASVMAFYSLPESYLDYDQMTKRIEKYQETRTLAYYHFVCRGTQDHAAHLALKLKRDVAELILHRPQLVEKLTAKV